MTEAPSTLRAPGWAEHEPEYDPADAVTVLAEQEWRALERSHQRRADALSAAHRARRERGERHPVEDFLWTYYTVKPGELRRWHPGPGVVLQTGAPDRRDWRYYGAVGDGTGDVPPDTTVDLAAFDTSRGATVNYIACLLRNTLEREPRFNCFGLHEWAMVYRMTPDELRHTSLPLRIGHEATDYVVESHEIACGHFDAFRFFTPEAAPLNTLRPTRDTQQESEQAGCLHAGMDLYKWASKIAPIVPGGLLLDCFEFARDIREVDMRASPYDVSGYAGADGAPLRAIPIETADGKREYARLQRGFALRGNALRTRLLDAIDAFRALVR